MNPLTKLREAVNEYDRSDPEFLLLEAARALIASPEFAEAELMARAREALGRPDLPVYVSPTIGNAQPPELEQCFLRQPLPGSVANCITVGPEWRP